MYRGRPPPRGNYPPSFEGRGPRPYPGPDYRDDRSRPKPPYPHGFHEPGNAEPYRRSPPRRRHPSPGAGSHRGGEYWPGGPPRERSPSPRKSVPLDHNLVITVGNELTSQSGSAPSHPHDRDFPARPDQSRAKSQGRSPDRSRAKSQGRSKSRPRSSSRSPDRSRAKSRGRSKSRPRSQSRSPDRSRAKSRGRSKSRPRERSQSPDRGRDKSRGRSKSRHVSRSRSKSRSRSGSRSRGRSRGRSFSKAASRVRSKSRHKSRSSSSSSSSSSRDEHRKKNREFRELEMARRRKEMEDMLNQPTKSILKKRNDSEDSPSVRSADSPRGVDGMSQIADQLLHAMKGMEPHMVASLLSELRSDPQMAQRLGLDTEIKEILNLLGGAATKAEAKAADDIDDEEKFLYGDCEEPKPPATSEQFRHHGLEQYGDVTEDTLYGDYPQTQPVADPTYGRPPVAAPHHQAPPTAAEPDTRYVSQPTVGPDQNLTVQVANPSCSADPDALVEYEKIQDLLKTIGLDLGVTEISKMAARTKERLHGNKPAPKTPVRRRQYSSGSSDGGRRRRSRSRSSSSSSSSSRSRSRGRKRGGSWSSDNVGRKSTSQKVQKDVKETKSEQPSPVVPPPHKDTPPITPNTAALPPHAAAAPVPPFPPPPPHNMMPPNFPPPGYGQYANYMPYMHQQWPPMYPPPNMSLPPPAVHEDFTAAQPYQDPYHQPGPELGVKVSVKVDNEKGGAKHGSRERKVSEKENNESQKQKVLEEREKLKQEREVRMKKKEYLMKELEQLRKQQGELLRKKRREKEGHKDPLLQEISHLQEDVMTRIANLRKEHEASEKKRSEIDKVALILGIGPNDRPSAVAKPAVDESAPPPEKKKREAEQSPNGRPASSGATLKTSAQPSQRPSPDEKPAVGPPPATPPPATPPPEPFEYYDAGNHWCKSCNVTSGSMFDFYTHLHSKTHRKTLDPYDRPWATTPTKVAKNVPGEEKLTKPAKGSEFLLPVRGFFCLLCAEFYGDAICAEEHVTTHSHNDKYKKQMYENPLYEQRRNLDRQAGLTSDTSGKKRKHDDDEKGGKDKEEKSKQKKKEKEKKKEDDGETSNKEEKIKIKKEEEEENLKRLKMAEDLKNAKSLEEEQLSLSKKEEKYRHSREDEERAERYKYSREDDFRHRYRRDDDDRPRYGSKNYEDRYKCNKYDSKSRYDRERDEGKPFKNPEPEKPAGQPGVSRPEPPPRPYDPPKIFCGPSPAMRAKLRKQSQEASKPAPVSAAATFGKFTWKKKENTLAKVAEKIAADFTKEDEAEASKLPPSVEDSFAKTMAVAKEIAEKLGNQEVPPPPFVSNGANQEWVRPNPRPSAPFFMKTNIGKAAPVNSGQSVRPRGIIGPLPKDSSDPFTKAMTAQNQLLGATAPPAISKPAPLEVRPIPAVSTPKPPEARPPFAVSRPAPFGPVPAPTVSIPKPPEARPPFAVSRPAPFGPAPALAVSAPNLPEAKPSLPVTRPAPFGPVPAPTVSAPKPSEAKPSLPVPRPAPFGPVPAPALSTLKPAPSVSKLVTTEATPAFKPPPSVAAPAPPAPKSTQPTMVKMVSDVAVPGVPESEQNLTVFVKPPPFMNMSDRVQKLDKLKTNQGVAKAQELLGIFYSRFGQSGPSITRPDSKADKSSNSSLPAPEAPKPKPQPLAKTQPQPSPVVHTVAQPSPVVHTVAQPSPVVHTVAQPSPVVHTPSPEIHTVPQPSPVVHTVSQPSPEGHTVAPPSPVVHPVPQPSPVVHPVPQPSPVVHTVAQPSPKVHTPSPVVHTVAQPSPVVHTVAQPLPKVHTPSPEVHTVAPPSPVVHTVAPPSPVVHTVPQPSPVVHTVAQPSPKVQTPSPEVHTVAPLSPVVHTVAQPSPVVHTVPQPSPVVHTVPQPSPSTSPTSPQDQPQSELQISSVWSLTCSATPEMVPTETSQSTQPTLTPSAQFEVHSEPGAHTSTSASESQTTAQTEPGPAPQHQEEPSADSESHQDVLSHLETNPDSTPEPKLKPSPKSRGKKTSPTSACPVRQTRYQTRQQQRQHQPEPELEASSESVDSDPRSLEILDSGASSQLEEGVCSEPDPQVMEITPETLGLPSDMTSLDFDYDFSFE